MAAKKKTAKRSGESKKPADQSPATVCFNKDCKLRKQKSCKGFEGCPGFQGK